MSNIAALPDVTPVVDRLEQMREQATSLHIENAAQFDKAGELLTELQATLKETAALYDPIVKARKAAHQAACDARSAVIEPIESLIRVMKGKISDYLQREAQRRAAEQREREEQARREAEARRIEEAALVAELGDEVSADALLDAPLTFEAPVQVEEAPKAAGVSTRVKWRGQVTDKATFVAMLATRPDLLHLVEVDESALNKYADALRENAALPGVRFYSETIVVGRSRR